MRGLSGKSQIEKLHVRFIVVLKQRRLFVVLLLERMLINLILNNDRKVMPGSCQVQPKMGFSWYKNDRDALFWE